MAKYEKTERLEKVPMEYLWEGLVLSDNLYNYNGSVLQHSADLMSIS